MYHGMTKLGALTILLAYRCDCGAVWGDKVSPDEAYERHPHLAGDTEKCLKCGKWHKLEKTSCG
jgi:hypothetical protein